MKSKNIISYVLSLCVAVFFLTSCDDDDRVENTAIKQQGLAEVATVVATSYSQYEATLSGSVLSDGASAVTEWGICIDTIPSPAVQIKATGSKDAFSVQVSNLEGGRLYYFRAYAINEKGISYGEEKIFTTEPIAPVVETLEITAKNTSIAAKGKLKFDGGISLMEKGFCYSLMAEPTIENGTVVTLSTDDFTTIIHDIEPFTDYYVRAYAINAVGLTYGKIEKVTTGDHPVFDMPFSESFSGGKVPPYYWRDLDHDGDGNSWFFYKYSSGTTTASSRSYQGGALTPYNFLITPKIKITGANPIVKWIVEANDEDDFAEHYKVVVSEVPITDANCEDPNIVKTVFEETLTTDAKQNRSANLSAYIGKNVYIAWVHYNCTNMSRIYVYGIEVVDIPEVIIFNEDFSGEIVPPQNWTMIDKDGDGKCWYYYKVSDKVHSAGSRSYEDVPLTPENYLISPKIKISGSNPTVIWKTAAHSSSYYEEHYKVVVSEVPITVANCGDPNIVKTVYDDILSTDDWVEKQANLSAYAGKEVYIAWVHYDVSDESRLYIADIKVIE